MKEHLEKILYWINKNIKNWVGDLEIGFQNH